MGGLIMKPFNIEEYLKNPSRKVVTREGRSARILCVDKKGGDLPIIALIQQCTRDNEIIGTFTKEGKWSIALEEHPNDLFFAPEKHEGWINVYKWGDDYRYTEEVFSSEERALMSVKCCDCVATIKIEWEE